MVELSYNFIKKRTLLEQGSKYITLSNFMYETVTSQLMYMLLLLKR